jgi:hypothetical protein
MFDKSEKEEQRQKQISINRVASEPILLELREAGFDIDWVSDLYNKRLNYKDAIPVLLNWLPRIDNKAVKEDIVRSLSVPWARKTIAPKLLVEEFRKPENTGLGLKWAIGNALSVVADETVCTSIMEMIRDESYGKAREMLVVSLGNMKLFEVEDFLIKLLKDENLHGYAIMALGKLRSKKSRPEIELFLTHSKTWVRNEAKKALKKIDKKSSVRGEAIIR